MKKRAELKAFAPVIWTSFFALSFSFSNSISPSSLLLSRTHSVIWLPVGSCGGLRRSTRCHEWFDAHHSALHVDWRGKLRLTLLSHTFFLFLSLASSPHVYAYLPKMKGHQAFSVEFVMGTLLVAGGFLVITCHDELKQRCFSSNSAS